MKSRDSEEILVSVCCLAYNQENYIQKCLDGFISQKTAFKIEVLIHDDASSDKTTKIIQEYQMRYPEIIRPIYQKENQFSKMSISEIYRYYIYPKVQGKYVAFCEGDDYWEDKYKLQKQVDVLEENEECHMCLHHVKVVGENGEDSGWGYPLYNIDTGVLSSYDFLKGLTDGYFFHTTSFLCRMEDIRTFINPVPEFYKNSDVDDVPLLLYFGQLGKNYYIGESMSCYRRNSTGSWTERQKGNIERIIKHKELMIDLYYKYDDYTKGKYKDLVHHWIDNERFMIAEYQNDFREMAKKRYSVFMKKRGIKYQIKVQIAALIPNFAQRFLKK